MVASRARHQVIEIDYLDGVAGGRDSDTTVVGTQTEALRESCSEHEVILISALVCHVIEPSAWRYTPGVASGQSRAVSVYTAVKRHCVALSGSMR
jgi:hypothetical protein